MSECSKVRLRGPTLWQLAWECRRMVMAMVSVSFSSSSLSPPPATSWVSSRKKRRQARVERIAAAAVAGSSQLCYVYYSIN